MLGGIVDILQFLISLFSSEEGMQLLSALLGVFSNQPKQEDDDDPEIEKLFEEISGKNKPSSKPIEEGYALSPISEVADRDIIYLLNKYFANA